MATKTKKKVSISLALLFLLSLLLPLYYPQNASAQGNQITVQTVSGDLGERVFLDISASNIVMAGYQFEVNYDPEYLDPISVQEYTVVGSFTANMGNMRFVWHHTENVALNELFKIEFEVIAEISGTTAVYIDPGSAYNEILDEEVNTIGVTYVPGGVTGTEEPSGGETPKSPSSDPCYIATAVYGSYDAGEVVALRNFRDNVLKKSFLGRLFIKTYYTLSPPVADYLKNAETLNSWTRNILDRLVVYLENSTEE